MTREKRKIAAKEFKEWRDSYYNKNKLPATMFIEEVIKILEQEPCEDAISRQAVDTLVDELARAISDERCCISRGRSTATIMQDILELPPVNPQEPNWDRLYSWLNDTRLGIAPDETVTDIDERNVRTAQVDLLDEIMEWIEKHPQEPKTGHWIDTNSESFEFHRVYKCSECNNTEIEYAEAIREHFKYCPNCGTRMVDPFEHYIPIQSLCGDINDIIDES